MTNSEIQKERKRLELEMARLETQKNILIAQLEGLEGQCDHKNAFKTSHMGESCRDCPTCGGCGI